MTILENKVRNLIEVGYTDLSLAKLAEAHWDALAILNEASKIAHDNALYAVWASEIPNKPLMIEKKNSHYILKGTKMFCSGAGLVDHALITTSEWLIDLDLTQIPNEKIQIIKGNWISNAFKDTNTATIVFNDVSVDEKNFIEKKEWYLQRIGFWKGALGPAACWGGGAAGLVDYGLKNSRKDPHTLAHLAAMESNVWAIRSFLSCAAKEMTMDSEPFFYQKLALKVRHLIEQLCTDVLRRFARAYGPFPLACESNIYQRYQELDLFLRQNHGERDLENLGRLLKSEENNI
ncbi:MAG: hypothetical protein HYX60_11565 [Legionella longbeachae]|nr:hypothetical protein [Legionella longbeachae]